MSLDWLNTLTPSINDTLPAYTTIAGILEAQAINNPFTDRGAIQRSTENVIATVVAEGMSHVGYTLNGGKYTLAGYHAQILDRYNISDTNFRSTRFSTRLQSQRSSVR